MSYGRLAGMDEEREDVALLELERGDD